ncbi:hypothetical protein EJ08DRAFT_697166 [Tothia fuscella]|uniref:Uncharacterized protein n=1 Tax=Tothia fuscella TaxID=1048955 RepID=A0A9P4TZA1_9PEZI|nr:hypothetical protein EJ08DRAFT_697166 [Tothia fuscella]
MDISTSHRLRRSFPNLQQLSLAPLSSRFPIDDDGYDQEAQDEPSHISSYSYIQGKSAPTTPGIISRDSSLPRKSTSHSKSKHAAPESFFAPHIDTDLSITKAQSSSALLNQGGHHVRRSTGTRSVAMLSPPASRTARQPQQNDEWLHRAGLVIASEMRESKGQSWLISRDSSTSLVDTPRDSHSVLMSGELLANDEFSPISPRYSRNPSRAASRAVSRVNSRRGSKVGSRIDFMTSMERQTPGIYSQEGYFDEVTVAEPDFVDLEDEGAVDDEEISRLAREKGSGLGGLVDRVVGFSLFNVDEDVENSSDEDHVEETVEEAEKRRQFQLKKRREHLEEAANNSANATTAHRSQEMTSPAKGEDSGWQDAAWLLSVASKVLY